MKISALVPVKNLDTAKSRLADVLSRNERRMFADLMLGDVLEVILKTPKIEKVFLVGDKQLSPKSGTFIIQEKFNNGYNEAISFALRDKRIANSDAIVILPGDIPLITTEEIENFSNDAPKNGIRIAPDRDREGTNALLLAPPTLIKTQFGKLSYSRHLELAEKCCSNVEVIDSDGLAFDIDSPEDLKDLCGTASSTKSYEFLKRNGIAASLLG